MKIAKISENFINTLSKNNIINEENAEIVKYGFELLILKALFFVICIFIGAIMSEIIESVLFAVSFTLLRSYAGGYHAKTKTRCFVLSLMTIILALVFCKFAVEFNGVIYVSFIISIISSVIIWFVAPVDTINKRLDKLEIKVYRRKTRIIIIIEFCALIALLLLNLYGIYFSIVLSIIAELILILIGYICNQVQ